MHRPNLLMRLRLQRYLLSCKVPLSAPLIFWKAELADGKAECCFLACAWRSTPQLPSQRIRAWRERMRGNRLAQAVYGSAKWMQPFPLLCLVRAIAVVALTRPPCHRLRRSPKSSRSTAHANVACARWLQGRRGAPGAARQSLGASQRRMLGNWCRDTHGDHAIALREVILAIHAFADRRLLCSKHWCSQPRFGAVLDGGCAAARQIRWRAVHNPTRPRQLQRVVETSA
jgi:hypothetical protein